MNCLQVKARLAAYVSGDLSAGDAAAVGDHLEGCTLCRSEAAAFEHCEEALGVLGAVAEAPDLSEDLRGRIAAPIPWRPRWGVAAAVAGAAVVVTAVAVLSLGPRKAPAPSAPTVAKNVTRRPVVSAPRAPDVTVEIPAVRSALAHSRPATVSAPRPVPAEVVAEQVASPAVVSVPDAGPESAEWGEQTTIEAAPVMASLRTQPEPAGGLQTFLVHQAVRPRARAKCGLVLLVGKPVEASQAQAYYVEIALPDGTRSVVEHGTPQHVAGAAGPVPAVLRQVE